MHFAANALVGESMTNPSKYFRNNVAAGINLLDAAVEAGVKKFIFSSTCATYGTPEKVPMDERLPQKPINPYGQSKLMFEQILNWYDKIHGLVYVNLRYFNAAGASEQFGEDHRIETHLIPNVLKVALGQKEKAEIYGEKYATPDGTCIRDYIHIHDLAAAHMLALEPENERQLQPRQRRGLFRPAGDRHRAARSPARPIPVVVKEPRAGDPPRLVASSHKITTRARLAAQVPAPAADHRKRLGLAPETPERLRGLSRARQVRPSSVSGASLTAGTVSFDYVELLRARPGAGRTSASSTTGSTATWPGTACSGSTRSSPSGPIPSRS